MTSAAVTCPHCGASQPPPALPDARTLDCTECDRSFGAPRGPGLHAPSVPPPSDAERTQGPTDVSLVRTGAIGLGATVVFFLAVVLPLRGTYVGELLGNRGWVPYAIAWLAFWSVAMLVLKGRALAMQRRAFTLDLLPETLAPSITPDNARAFASHVHATALPVAPSFLAERLERALETFGRRRNARDVLDQLALQSGSDAAAVESSYTMLRVFIWAIPILGFIGTVVGIGSAVAGFSSSVASAVDLEVMKGSIGAVTSGLGVAFDTTLLALVVSIAIMFPTSSLQKAEEDFLARIDRWCDRRLAHRLDDGSREAMGDLRSEVARLASSVDALQRQLARPGAAEPSAER